MRLMERGSTDRCRIVEEQRSIRAERIAEVAKVNIEESAKTERESQIVKEETARMTMLSQVRLEEKRMFHGRWWSAGMIPGVLLGMLLGRTRKRLRILPSAAISILIISLFISAIRMFGNTLSIPRILLQMGRRQNLNSIDETASSEEDVTPVPTCEAQVAGETGSAPCPPEDAGEGNSSDDVMLQNLQAWGLAAYARDLELAGYDEEVFRMLSRPEAEEMMRCIKCKPGHKVRFRQLLEHLSQRS